MNYQRVYKVAFSYFGMSKGYNPTQEVKQILERAMAHSLPTNPDKPDQYQWEALTDEQSKKLITQAIRPFQKKTKLNETAKREKDTLQKAKNTLLRIKWGKKK